MFLGKFLITGANGFVGQALCAEAMRRGLRVRGAMRSACELPVGVELAIVGPIDGKTDWTSALRNVDVVIHLAARVHVMKDDATAPLAEFLKVNLHGTENLAQQAASAGVKRLVYVSSIKVNGEETLPPLPSPDGTTDITTSHLTNPAQDAGQVIGYSHSTMLPKDSSQVAGYPPQVGREFFCEEDACNPQDPYAVSKWRTEQVLQRIAQETGLEVVIVRPPLVYGPGVKGNFIKLLAAVDKGIPLPLASVHNKRSLIYLGNLVDALIACASHPAAAGKTYLMRDGEDIATPDLVRQMAIGLERPARLFHVPVRLLRGLSRLFGKRESVERIVSSLRVNDDLIRKELDWKPRFTLQQGLQATTDWYRAQRRSSGVLYLNKRPADDNADCNVSLVIVNYNAGEMLLECIASAQQAGQIIVVDNASTDNSIAALRSNFPATRIICNERNLGFAAACNLGAQVADGEHVLFLNPDCILDANAISILVQEVNSAPDVGMVGGLLTNPSGTEQGGGRRAVPTPWRSFVRAFGFSALGNRYPRLFSDFELHRQPLPDHSIEVEAISGACMLVRRDALEDVGLLDEGYFMHCEDLDWCMRFRQKGWRIIFVPGAEMVHHQGHCSKSRPIFVEWHKHKGMMRFYRKFFWHQYPGVLMGLVTVGVWVRFISITGYYLTDHLLRKLRLRRG